MFDELYKLIENQDISHRTRFHKEMYVEGQKDTFVHIDMGTIRKLAKKYQKSISKKDWHQLMTHTYHEFRLLALIILIKHSQSTQTLSNAFQQYISYINYIDNWDLVDVSAPDIVGRYMYETKDFEILNRLILSKSMWENRIASVSCLYLIRRHILDIPLGVIEKQLKHSHDLMHKANGWMLREIGKQDRNALDHFLKEHYQSIPRTTLRYAIERHQTQIRKRILGGDFKWL